METRIETLRKLARAVDVLDLADRLEKADVAETCDGTFRIAQTANRSADWRAVERLLKALGGHCDCEVYLNVIADLTDEEMDAMYPDE